MSSYRLKKKSENKTKQKPQRKGWLEALPIPHTNEDSGAVITWDQRNQGSPDLAASWMTDGNQPGFQSHLLCSLEKETYPNLQTKLALMCQA